MDFNANISVSETDFETYIGNLIDERVDYDDLASKVVEHIDIDEIIHNLDYSDVADRVQSNLDYSELAREIYDELDIDRIADSVNENLDVSYEAEKLLESYSPGNGCNLGSAFTSAIHSGMSYIFEENYEDIKSTLIKMLFGNIIDDCINEAKPQIIREYLEMERMKKIEEEKRANELAQQSQNVPNVTTASVVNNYGV